LIERENQIDPEFREDEGKGRIKVSKLEVFQSLVANLELYADNVELIHR